MRGLTSLAGPDVILVHRILKNSVPVSEHVLMTETVLDRCPAEARVEARPQDEDLVGLRSAGPHPEAEPGGE